MEIGINVIDLKQCPQMKLYMNFRVGEASSAVVCASQ